MAYLPIAWVGDHIFSYAQAFLAGLCVNCPESPETVAEDRREIGSDLRLRAAARLREHADADHGAHRGCRHAEEAHVPYLHRPCQQGWREDPEQGTDVGLWDRLLWQIGNVLVYAPLRNRFGMTRVKVGYTAGEAIGPEIFRFYRSIGVNLKQLYGQTEASVYITCSPTARSAPTPWPPCPAGRDPHRRQRRGALPLAGRVRGLLQG